MGKKEKCGNCKYWDFHKGRNEVNPLSKNIDSLGNCRRHSPLFMLIQISPGNNNNWEWPETHFGCWPVTEENDWCGEFEAETK